MYYLPERVVKPRKHLFFRDNHKMHHPIGYKSKRVPLSLRNTMKGEQARLATEVIFRSG